MAGRLRTFWQRISDGVTLQEIWTQFHAEARASYELYSKEVDWAPRANESHVKRALRLIRAVFWAMMMKLSPGRRVLFLISLVLLAFPNAEFRLRG